MADVPKPPVDNRPVYQRLVAARRNTAKRAREEVMLLAWLTRYLLREGCPVHIGYAQHIGQSTNWPYVVCVHSSVGQMSWRVTTEEVVAYFSHLKKEKCRYDGHTSIEKMNRIEALLERMDAIVKGEK